MSRNREGTSTPTTTQLESTTDSSRPRFTGTLRLRGEPLATEPDSTEGGPSSSRRIRWAESVIDNEGLGRKSSKVCCIFHKSRPAGESSSESDSEPSSSDDESDSDVDTGEARASNGRRRQQQQPPRQRQCHHDEADQNHEHGHKHDDGDGGDGNSDPDSEKRDPARRKRKPKPNAYERMPHNTPTKPDGGKEAS